MGVTAGRGLVVAAPVTGSGKTSVTLGLLRAYSRRGHGIAPAKVGPDYIDPRFHEVAAGRTSVNLDGWAMRPHYLATLARALAETSGLAIVEGVMGLFDGAPEPERPHQGTTAEIARLTGWPILFVVDASRLAQSVAPLVRGFRDHDPNIGFAGVILNKVGGAKHQAMLSRALDDIGVAVFGCLPREESNALPSRHLGLVQAEEQEDLDGTIDRLADQMESHLDLDAIAAAAAPYRESRAIPAKPMPPFGQRIAVARDVAFRFVYPHLLDGWRANGAEILPFSPLEDEAPAGDADAIYLPGGYPELHGPQLAAARNFKTGLRHAAQSGTAIFGECGGYMVLGHGIIDADGRRHEMTGLINLETSFAERKLHIGYRDVEALGSLAGHGAGTHYKAHEFHYASTLKELGEPLFTNHTDGTKMGLRAGNVTGSFAHLIDVTELSAA